MNWLSFALGFVAFPVAAYVVIRVAGWFGWPGPESSHRTEFGERR